MRRTLRPEGHTKSSVGHQLVATIIFVFLGMLTTRAIEVVPPWPLWGVRHDGAGGTIQVVLMHDLHHFVVSPRSDVYCRSGGKLCLT